MFRPLSRGTTAVALVSTVLATAVSAQTPVFKSSVHDYRVTTVVDGLVNPWSMAFLPGGDMLVTERPGRLRIVRSGKLLPTPVAGVPEVFARGQGGLLDVVPHPNFATNKLVYISYSKPQAAGQSTTAVIRARFENDKLTDVKEVFLADTKGAPGHYGSRLAFDKDGFLFITVGERQVAPSGNLEAHPAQDITNHHGTINRIFDDGRVPTDNPFVDKPNAKHEIWSYGHRNPQGLVIHPTTGDIWATEHGPQGGDELNLIKRGANYGWPVIGFGVNYGSGNIIHSSTRKQGMEQPVNVWVPSIGTSGLMLYSGDKFPAWKGSLFVGGLVGEQLVRVSLTGQTAQVADILVRNQGRIRDVRQGLDGLIYLAIDNSKGDPTPIVRLEPVARR
jgi:glucose/arabinose dehydrogenase